MPIPKGTTSQDRRTCGRPAGSSVPSVAVSLPVIDDKRSIRKSRMGPRRALVLAGVHAIIGLHILHWLVYGMTVSPVEPSESMYTINLGKVNTGFVFFVLAILSTLVFGRFFCGWACHVVALQDLCGWAMKKLGVKPKPFRSRLLVFAPLVLAVYMFAWPTIKREVIRPVLGPTAWAAVAPHLGEAGERPEVQAAFMTRDFWETFPPWYVAIPFLAACGFGCVYLLGAKGFCTYGCPYGGVFGPADRLAVGRIRVTDACEHCGHCTAVCTSNVRVHEEVRDYGMVVDPGCMKCMDCVSVCPNDALYFGFGKPATGAKPRVAEPARFKATVYDLTGKEELLYGALFILLVVGFRGMLGLVPLLMAMGLAGITTFLVWKLVSMVRLPNVRVQNVQLKLKGAMRPAGALTAILALALAAIGIWGGVVNMSMWRGSALDATIPSPLSEVLNPRYRASERDQTTAAAALRHLSRAGSWTQGGIGWERGSDWTLRVARLQAIVGDRTGAEQTLERSLQHESSAPVEDALIVLTSQRALSAQELEKSLRALLARQPGLSTASLRLAQLLAETGRTDEAASLTEATLARSVSARNMVVGARLLVQLGRVQQALDSAARGTREHPESAALHEVHGLLLAGTGRLEDGLAKLKKAADLEPENPSAPGHIAALLRESGRESEASEWQARANRASQAPKDGR